MKLSRFDPKLEENQIESLKKLKNERDHGKVGAALDKLKMTAGGNANLMPSILGAVKAYATLGEICGVLRS